MFNLDLALEICDIGRRLSAAGYVVANDGNISHRLGPDAFLCTPTLINKGRMTPRDLCIVDLQGKQLWGVRKRTSEILLHLEVYKARPDVSAVVHCHAPCATAFALAGEKPPSGIVPEAEIFLGDIPIAPYETPGNANFAATIQPFLASACAVVLSNHGTITWGPNLQQAFWNTEVLEAYCRMLLLAKHAGGVNRLPDKKVLELLALRPAFGLPADPRTAGAVPLHANPDFARRVR
ncbi:MAG: class II aldolase/adducin family protein [Phycisphaerales bacterium]|nr:class II aldolase/adducin family protein [Phycisphaerales bacterium]